MRSRPAIITTGAALALIACGAGHARAATAQTVEPAAAAADGEAAADAWIDRTQRWVYTSVWRSAMRIDGLFGPVGEQWRYEQTNGSITPAMLWDEFDGWQPQLRFRVNLPLPRLDERFGAFIGRVNRDEYVTEREEESGSLPRQYGVVDDDQTIFGIAYREPWRQGWRFSGGGGVRVSLPPDPYLKGSFIYETGNPRRLLLNLRETVFWQNSERLGITSRIDLARLFGERWLVRSTASATVSQESEGMRGYATLLALRSLRGRRALAGELFLTAETDAEVPVRDYGVKLAYRQSLARSWLVLELRTSLTWPRELTVQSREPSLGVGVGMEMYFGTDEFSAQPVTF